MKMKKKSLRFVAGVLAVTMLISSNSVFATTTAEYDTPSWFGFIIM